MKNNYFFGFTENLIRRVVEEYCSDKSVLIFPTESSKAVAQKEYQNRWEFEDILFLTLEEFKESLFVTELPILREEKRNLMLYYSVPSEILKEFKISNYFQFIDLAKNFFSIWEEFNEEMLPVDKSFTDLLNGEEFPDWQEPFYERLQKMRKHYQETLSNNSFTDKIFLYEKENTKLDAYKGYDNFIFVNQYYYTKLEDWLTKELSSLGKKVVICNQNIEQNSDNKEPFSLAKVKEYRTKKIKVFQATNDHLMFKQLFTLLNEENSLKNIIDSKLWRSPYSRFLSSKAFRGLEQETITNSQFYQFFQHLLLLIDSLEYEGEKKRTLIPLEALQQLFSNQLIVQYFTDEKTSQSDLLDSINKLRKEDYKYVDTDLYFFEHLKGRCAPLKAAVNKVVRTINRLSEITTLRGLTETIGGRGWFPEKVLFTEAELKQSNIVDIVFETLNNFVFLDDLNILNKIKLTSPTSGLDQYTQIRGFLRLFLLYLRPKRFRWYLEGSSGGIDVSSLLDSRNLLFNTVALLNVNEGDLPSNPSTPFFFTEVQRKQIGLKCYEDIRNWDRYYFFRLVLNTEYVYLFTQKNESKDKMVSSFVEELKKYLPDLVEEEILVEDAGYDQLYSKILTPASDYSPAKDLPKDINFYTIPYVEEDVLKDQQSFKASYTAYSMLSKSPFYYYIQHVMKINELYTRAALSPAFIGVISHYLVERVWNILVKEYGEVELAGKIPELSKISKGILDNLESDYLYSDKYYYKIPHTYSYTYFEKIFLPIIKDGIVESFQLPKKLVTPSPDSLVAEPEQSSKEIEVKSDSEDLPFPVFINGKADLQLKLKGGGETRSSIIDFKTSKLSGNRRDFFDQLLFYECLYFSDLLNSKVSSYIYTILESKYSELMELNRSEKKREELLLELPEKIKDQVKNFVENGFGPGADKQRFDPYANILRKDLLIKNSSTIKAGGDK